MSNKEELAYLAQNGNDYNPPQEGEDGDYAGYSEWLYQNLLDALIDKLS
jgi:hypothetical protein